MMRAAAALLAMCLGVAEAGTPGDAAADPVWLKLGRWEPEVLGRGYRSNIVTESFFLAPGGAHDPQAELIATMNAMSGPLGEDPDRHALCRFPARALFLETRLDLGLPDPFDVCPALGTWSQDDSIRGVSVLYVAGYFSNPGSAFGHILLRLHTDEADIPVEDVLDKAINYGARPSEDDPMPVYVARGLTGRYRSTFSTLDFYHHNERYRAEQLRDIWQYRLDLADDRLRLLTAHVWELLGARNRYYFLRQNCAYRIAELLELVADRPLIPRSKAWMAPVDVFHMLTDELPGGAAPPVGSVTRLASRETLFAEGYSMLTEEQKAFVDRATGAGPVDFAALEARHGLDDPAAAYDVVLDYFSFADDHPEAEERRAAALRARFALPAGRKAPKTAPKPPHLGQRSSLVEIGARSNDRLGAGALIRVRPAYFDFLSATEGTQPFSELGMADLTLVARDGSVHLRRLEVVRVTGLYLSETGGPDRDARAWRTRFGAEVRDLSCDACLLAFGEAGIGEAVGLGRNGAVYGLLGARLEAGDRTNSTLSGVATAGVVLRGQKAGFALEGGLQQGADNAELTLPFARAELRLRNTLRSEMSLTAEVRRAAEFGLSWRGYW